MHLVIQGDSFAYGLHHVRMAWISQVLKSPLVTFFFLNLGKMKTLSQDLTIHQVQISYNTNNQELIVKPKVTKLEQGDLFTLQWNAMKSESKLRP